MGEKRIVISDCILEDLIYGRLKGPVFSDAPIDLKIVGVYSEMDRNAANMRRTGNFNVIVEHSDFEEIAQFIEIPILEIKFSTSNDPTTTELVKLLREQEKKALIDPETKDVLRLAAHFLETNDAEKMHLVERNMEYSRKIIKLEDQIKKIVSIGME